MSGDDATPETTDLSEESEESSGLLTEQVAARGLERWRWLLDDIVLLGFASGSLITAVLLQISQSSVPPTLISLLLGIAVAAITYRYLGGASDAQFNIAVLKLGGSAALLSGITYFVGQELERQNNLILTRDQFVGRIADKDEEIETLRVSVRELEESVSGNDKAFVDRIATLDPDADLVRDVRQALLNPTGPGQTVVRESEYLAMNNASVRGPMNFWVCEDTWNELYPAARNAQRVLRFYGDSSTVTDLNYAGAISRSQCSDDTRSFEFHLSCDASMAVFPDLVLDCNGNRPVYSSDSAEKIRSVRVGVPIDN